jgi:predicted RNA-binding protein with TRAM domain
LGAEHIKIKPHMQYELQWSRKVKLHMYGDRFSGSRDRGGFSNERSMTPPVREGEEIDVTIEAVGEKGDGIAKQKGFVLFVPGVKAGERVKIKITRVLAKVGFAQVVGPATTTAEEAQQHQRPARKAEPEFEPKEELDTEDFGEESETPDES